MNRSQKLEAALIKSAVIEKVDGKWVLWTKDKSRRLGTHDSAREAYAQEYAIEKSQEREDKKASAYGPINEADFIKRLMQREGGYKKIITDSGGVTKGGIAASGKAFTPAQIKKLTPEQINQYWSKMLQRTAPVQHPGVREILFDMEANMGPRAWTLAREQANALLPQNQRLRIQPAVFDATAAARVNQIDQDTYAGNLINAYKAHHQGLAQQKPKKYNRYTEGWSNRRNQLWNSPTVTPLHKVQGPATAPQPAPKPVRVKPLLPPPPGYTVEKLAAPQLNSVGDSGGVVEAEVCKCEGPCTCVPRKKADMADPAQNTNRHSKVDPAHNLSQAPPASSTPTVPDASNKINSAYDLKSRYTPMSNETASGNKALTVGAPVTKQSSLWFGKDKMNLDFSPKTTSGSDSGFLQRYLLSNGTKFGQNPGLIPTAAQSATLGIQMGLAPVLNMLALPAIGATVDKGLGRPGSWRQNYARYLPSATPDQDMGYFTKGWTNTFGAPYQTEGSLGDVAHDATKGLAPVVLDTKEQLYKMLGIGQ